MPSAALTLEQHRLNALQISSIMAESKTRVESVWFSSIGNFSSNGKSLLGADGRPIVSIPSIVGSGYDASIKYDVSDFYKKLSNVRPNFILNYSTNSYGEIFSIGFDSGAKSQKLVLDKSFFVGYSQSVFLSKNTIFSLSTGGWLLGKLTEKQCYDEYDREYHCATLTAWSDYAPPKMDRFSYFVDLKFQYNF